MNHAPGPERGACDFCGRPLEARLAAPVLYGLTHDREPGSYFNTRVRPVAPSTRTAYWARAPCTYSVPEVAVPSGLTVRMRAVPIRTPSAALFRTPSTSGIPIVSPK